MVNQKSLRNIFLLLTALFSITSCEIKGDKRKHRGTRNYPGDYNRNIRS